MRIVPEAGGEHGPEVVGTEIEKDLRDVVRADVRNRAKNEQMRKTGQQRAEQRPDRPQDRLAVPLREVLLREDQDQILIFEQFFQIQLQQVFQIWQMLQVQATY